jgi:hypothetical protein
VAPEPDVKVIVPAPTPDSPVQVFDRWPVIPPTGPVSGVARSPRTAVNNPCADLQTRTYATLNDVRRAHALCDGRGR